MFPNQLKNYSWICWQLCKLFLDLITISSSLTDLEAAVCLIRLPSIYTNQFPQDLNPIPYTDQLPKLITLSWWILVFLSSSFLVYLQSSSIIHFSLFVSVAWWIECLWNPLFPGDFLWLNEQAVLQSHRYYLPAVRKAIHQMVNPA